MKQINIDESSGFCWGVVQTIEKAENCLQENKKQIYVLGEIIHNPNEIERLAKKNLITINHNQLENLDKNNSIVVIRAHGEPPATYQKINKLELELVDATCPLVKQLQNKILQHYIDNWQIIIFGKYEHAEVIGLRGVCNDECIVILNADEALEKIDFSKKIMLCSQTTMDVNALINIKQAIEARAVKHKFIFHNTVCKFVISREESLKKFAKQNKLVIFVAGHYSSNGKVLFGICKSVNSNSILVENFGEIDLNILQNIDTIGITGATSTPKWLLEEIKNKIIRNV